MLRVGIVGAENSHTVAIAKTINIDKKIKNCQVVCVWGETQQFAEDAAERGEIETIVRRPADMVGKIDAAVVDHRHGKYHLPAVEPLLEAKLPLFIDKPFCYRLDEGRKFLARAKKLGVPVTSFSVLPLQRSFRKFGKDLAELGAVKAVTSYGPCDIKSQYGGIFFYGIHQIDAILKLFGNNVKSVQVNKWKDGGTASLFYDDGFVATANLIKEGAHGFHMAAVCEGGVLSRPLTMDKNAYLTGTQTFTTMFRTGEEPLPHADLLAPVAVLEALENSVKSGKRETVRKFG